MDDNVDTEHKTDCGSQKADERREAQRLDGKRRKAVNPQQQQLFHAVARAALDALAVVDLDVAHLSGGAKQQTAHIGIRVLVTEHLVYHIALAGEVAHYFQILGLAQQPARHKVVHFAAEVSEARMLFVFVFGEHQIEIIKLVYQLEHLVGGGLSVVVKADDDVARKVGKARHDSAVLTEVARQLKTLDARVRL